MSQRPRYPFTSPGFLGTVTPYYVPSQCYDMPTDDHPEKGGFRTELQDAQAACDGCKGKLKQTSPGPYCSGVRDACTMWGHIPEGTDPSKITPQQLDDCVAQCKTDVATAMVRKFCDTGAGGSAGADAAGAGAGGSSQESSSGKSSTLAWVLGGLALAAVGAGVVIYARSAAPKRNPVALPPPFVAPPTSALGPSQHPPVLRPDGSFSVWSHHENKYETFRGYIPEGYGLSKREWDEIHAHLKEFRSQRFVLEGHPGMRPFTIEQFGRDNKDLDPEVFEVMHAMRVGQTSRFDLGAGGVFGVKRVS